MLCSRYSRFSLKVLRHDVRYYAYNAANSGIQKVKEFEPSLEAGKSTIKTKTKDISSIAIEKVNANKKNTDKIRTRRFYIWDKWILVKLGKYKSISDVPDQVTYAASKIGREEKEKINAEIKEKLFVYGIGVDYMMWIFTFLIGGTALYVYYVKRPQDEIANPDTKISNEVATSK